MTCSQKCQWCTSIHLLHILAPPALLSLSAGGALAPPAPPYFAPMNQDKLPVSNVSQLSGVDCTNFPNSYTHAHTRRCVMFVFEFLEGIKLLLRSLYTNWAPPGFYPGAWHSHKTAKTGNTYTYLHIAATINRSLQDFPYFNLPVYSGHLYITAIFPSPLGAVINRL